MRYVDLIDVTLGVKGARCITPNMQDENNENNGLVWDDDNSSTSLSPVTARGTEDEGEGGVSFSLNFSPQQQRPRRSPRLMGTVDETPLCESPLSRFSTPSSSFFSPMSNDSSFEVTPIQMEMCPTVMSEVRIILAC